MRKAPEKRLERHNAGRGDAWWWLRVPESPEVTMVNGNAGWAIANSDLVVGSIEGAVHQQHMSYRLKD